MKQGGKIMRVRLERACGEILRGADGGESAAANLDRASFLALAERHAAPQFDWLGLRNWPVYATHVHTNQMVR